VLSSTSAIYGDAECERNIETLTPSPLSPYALSKLAGELYGRIFTRSGKLEVACLRYFNVYGPRQSVTSAYAAVIPIFITRIFDNKPITIFGDGEQTRDFVFAEDVARANTLAMEAPAAAGEVFNISGDNRISLNDLVNDLRHLMRGGEGFEVNYTEPRAGDIKHSRADITKAKDGLGFIPKVTFSEGLGRTIQAFKG
jgi:UDP-glucose 4-epimerase